MKRVGLLVIALMVAAFAAGMAAQVRAEVALRAATELETVKGDLKGAIEAYRKIGDGYPENRAVRAQALVRMAGCYQKLGDAQARQVYERIVREFGDQPEPASKARTAIAQLTSAVSPAESRSIDSRRQLHEPEQVAEWGRVSPDGQLMSFNDVGRGASGNLGVWDLRSGKTRLITNSPCCEWTEGYAESSAWSPDGQQLAYAWLGEGARRVSLRVVPSKGGPHRVLLLGKHTSIGDSRPGDVTWVHPFAWSPDGKSILAGFGRFVSSGVVGESRLVALSVADGRVTTLKELGRSFPDSASFSPDGRYIIYDYAAEEHDRRDVFIMAADGSGHTALVQDPASHDTALTWVDASRILYVSDRSGSRDVWLLRTEGGKRDGEAALVRRSVGDGLRSLGRTKDGTLLTERSLQLSDVFTVRVDPQTGRAIEDPSPLARAQSGVTRGQATWAPDGSRIAYFMTPRASGRSRSLAVQDVRTGAFQSYPLTTENPERIVWRPDGKAVVFNAATERNAGGETIYSADLTTGAVTAMAPGVQAAFSPDGRYFYYPRPGELVRRDLRNGSEDVVQRGQGAGRALAMSPDGGLLATFLNGAVVAIPTQGGEPRTLVASRLPDGTRPLNPITWSPDGKYLFIASMTAVWRVPAIGGEVKDTGIKIDGVIKRLSHGAGNQLAISIAKGALELWAEPLTSLASGR